MRCPKCKGNIWIALDRPEWTKPFAREGCRNCEGIVRVTDLSGIVATDFIDYDDPKNLPTLEDLGFYGDATI